MRQFSGAALAASLLLAGCATNPNQISASYVSSVPYQNYSCEQLGAEAQRVSNAASAATGAQSSQASKDAVMTTVGIVLFWPALFFIGGDKGNAAEIARLKGEMNAIEQANIANDCGIQFQKPASR